MLLRFNYDKKKAKKTYRRRCWTEYWYLSIMLIISFIVMIYSYVSSNTLIMFVSPFCWIAIMLLRHKLASKNCKMGQNIDITDEHLIVRWVRQEDTFGYDSNLDYVHQNSRKIKMKTVIPLNTIHNLQIDIKSRRIMFDYEIHKSKACKKQHDTKKIGHMVIYDVYDKSLADELLLQIHKS